MKRWFIGTNSYHKTASYDLEEAPWYIFSLEEISMTICGFLLQIPIINWSVPWGDEWSLATVFHCYVDAPIFSFCGRKTTSWSCSIEYEEALRRHPELLERELEGEENGDN